MRSTDFIEGHFVDSVPARFHDRRTVLLTDFSVGRADNTLGFRRHYYTLVFLTDMKLTHQAQAHELLSRASLCVAVVEVPCCCLEIRSLASPESSFAFWVSVLGECLLATVRAFFALVAKVFLMADHVGWRGVGFSSSERMKGEWHNKCVDPEYEDFRVV